MAAKNTMCLTYSQAAAMWDFLLAFESHSVRCYPVVAAGVRAIMAAQREAMEASNVVALRSVAPAKVAELDKSGAMEIEAAAPVEALAAWALEGAEVLRGLPGVRFEHHECETMLREFLAQ
jgi:hypothetical protein